MYVRTFEIKDVLSHFLRGSVDWNRELIMRVIPIGVTSFAEVWIEILLIQVIGAFPVVTSFAEVWIEISGTGGEKTYRLRHFLRGSVDWNLLPDL